jgi:hypothetical protein
VVGEGFLRAAAGTGYASLIPAAVISSRKTMRFCSFSIGIEQRSIVMAELYLRDDSNAWRTSPSVVRPGDPRFFIVANIAAGWLYEIAGSFFWGALILLLVLGGAPPP